MSAARALAAGLLLAAGAVLGSCGLQPVYSGGATGAVAAGLADIAIAPIANRRGYLVGNALREALGPVNANPQFRIEIELEEQILGFGIRDNNTIAAERITLRARYTVKDAGGTTLLLATTGSDVSIDNASSSDFATVAAETTAIERLSIVVAQQIAQRLGVFAKSGKLVAAAPQ
ncbi:MAG: LPS assembly lipoprotein LptE [Polymorphobacter sp.]